MRIKSGFELREVCGETIIVSFGVENIDFSSIISLNETAAYLWSKMEGQDSFTVADMVKALTDEYEVGEDEARLDCEQMAGEWIEAGLVEA